MGIFEALGLGVKDDPEGEDEMFGRNRRQSDDMYEDDNLYNQGGYDERDGYDDYEEPRNGMFSRKERPAPVQRQQPSQDPSKVRVLIYKPLEYADTQNIIDNLKEKKSIVVNLDDLATEEAQRILDFIAGAVYALNGSIKKAARNIFVVAPYNVDVSANEGDQAEDFSHDQY